MPRDENEAVLKISSSGLRKAERMTQLAGRYVREAIQEMVEETGLTAEAILQNNAPERTGRLRESILVTGRNRSTTRPQIRVGVVGAVSDEGFDYLNVTRFGRKAVEAAKGSKPARSLRDDRTQRQRRPFRAHMLSFEPGAPGSGFRYRRRVRAYHPKRDWVRASTEEIKVMSEFNFREVTKAVESYLKRPSAQRTVSVQAKSRGGNFR